MNKYTGVHAIVHTLIHTFIHIFIHTFINTLIHTLIHTLINIFIHTLTACHTGMMKYAVVCLLMCVGYCAVSSLSPSASEYVKAQQSIASTDAQLQTLYETLKGLRSSTYRDEYVNSPTRPAAPQTLSAITQLTTNMKKLRKSLLKGAEVQEGQSPEEMMLYHKLLSGLKRTSRSSRAVPALRAASQEQVAALSGLTEQINALSRGLESAEVGELHRRAHAQSRLLHRMTHVLDAMGDELSAGKRRHYETLLSTLLDQHLSDPDYRDGLSPHLLAHHLVRSRGDAEFGEHLARHVLYGSLDRPLGVDDAVGASTGAVLAGPLRGALAQAQARNAVALSAASAGAAQTSAAENAALRTQLGQRTNNQYAYTKQ